MTFNSTAPCLFVRPSSSLDVCYDQQPYAPPSSCSSIRARRCARALPHRLALLLSIAPAPRLPSLFFALYPACRLPLVKQHDDRTCSPGRVPVAMRTRLDPRLARCSAANSVHTVPGCRSPDSRITSNYASRPAPRVCNSVTGGESRGVTDRRIHIQGAVTSRGILCGWAGPYGDTERVSWRTGEGRTISHLQTVRRWPQGTRSAVRKGRASTRRSTSQPADRSPAPTRVRPAPAISDAWAVIWGPGEI